MTIGVIENTEQQLRHSEPLFLTERVNHYHKKNSTLPLSESKEERAGGALNFSEPDYLGLAHHPSIIDASIRALMDAGSATSQQAQLQERFEGRFADFLNAEAVVFLQSAWSPNVNLLRSVSDKKIPIYRDTLANLSIREAIESVEASAFTYPRESADTLEALIKANGAGIIIVDAISSVDGTLAPLAEIARLSDEHRCLLVVDESHSLGIYNNGKGLVSHLGLGASVHFITANLTKTFCCPAGVIVGSMRNIDYIRYQAKEVRFGHDLLPQDIAKFSATLNVIQKDEWRRVKLSSNANYLRTRLYRSGFNIKMKKSHIVNLISSKISEIESMHKYLHREGVSTELCASPVTPEGFAVIRFVVNARHNKQQLDDLISIIDKH